MKLVINTNDGDAMEIANFDATSFMQMLDDWDSTSILTFALDNGMAYIPKTAITRIDTFD